MNRALHKIEVLSTLLKDISGVLDDGRTRRIDDALKEFGNDTPPPSLSVPIKSRDKRSRRTSSSDEMDRGRWAFDEAHVSSSAGSDNDLDCPEEDLLRDQRSSETGYVGRNSQIQWMRTLQRKLAQTGGGPSDMPFSALGDSEETSFKCSDALHERQKQSACARSLSDYYFYLDDTEINIDFSDPDVVPFLETAEKLFEFYQVAVHNPFRILDSSFKDELRTYYQVHHREGTMNVCVKWKAILNLVFAIGARFSHLVSADWRADGGDHHVYMSGAVQFLELKQITTLVCPPDVSLIQVNVSVSYNPEFQF